MMGDSDPLKDMKPGQQYRRSCGGKNKRFNPLNAAKLMYISGYKAPTPLLENFIYKMGAARCTAQYNIINEKLTNYIQSNYKSGLDIAQALRLLQDMTYVMPPRPTGGTDTNGNALPPDNIEVHMFKRVYDQEFGRETKYQENKKKAYSLITENCSPEMKAGLKALDDWDVMEMTQD